MSKHWEIAFLGITIAAGWVAGQCVQHPSPLGVGVTVILILLAINASIQSIKL